VNWAPFWHPDGQRLVFATSRVGHHNYEVFEIDATAGNSTMPARYGTTSRRVTNGDGFDGLPAFNPDGTLMIWTGQRGEDRSSQLFIAPFVEASGHGTSETTSATEQAH